MARLSDLIRRGEGVLQRQEKQREQSETAQAQDTPSDSGEAEFRTLPSEGFQPGEDMRKDFPILTQIHNEVGTAASVVNKINQISDFINAFTGRKDLQAEPVVQVPTGAPQAAAPSPPDTRSGSTCRRY